MSRFPHGMLSASVALATLILLPARSAEPALAQATAAKGITAHLQVSGDQRYTETLSHAEDGTFTVPSKYSCVHFTHPNFAPKGKSQAYALSFNNPDVMASTSGAFVSFYYDAKKLKSQHIDGAGESV